MGKLAFLFPGQGSQKIGMGSSFAENFPHARSVYEQASLSLGFDVAELCFYGPEEKLRATENAQVALFTTSVAAWCCMLAVCDRKPDAVAGHSIGEYAALVASESLGFGEAIQLVRRRGELMRDAAAAAPGTMAAILGLEAEAARTACEKARETCSGVVTVANYNGGGQIVISGEQGAVGRASEIAKELGAKRVLPLPVSGAFHSPLMVTAGDSLYHDLAKASFRKPAVPVVSNVTARYVESPGDLVGGLTMQVSGSVRWEESIRFLIGEGFDTFVELGSGEVLTGLMRRIDRSVAAIAVTDADSLQKACTLLTQ